MNPRTTYKSLKSSDFITRFLLFLICLQFSVITISQFSINLPKFIADHLTELLFSDPDLNIEYDFFKISPKGEVSFSNLKIIIPGNYGLEFTRGKINFNLSKLFNKKQNLVDYLTIDGACIFSKNISKQDINIERIYSKMIKKGGLYLDLSSEVLKKSIYAKGLIKLDPTGMKGIDEKINLSSFIKSVDNLFQKSTNHFSSINLQNLWIKYSHDSSSKVFFAIDSIEEKRKDNKLSLKDLNIDASSEFKFSKFKALASLSSLSSQSETQKLLMNNLRLNYSLDKNHRHNLFSHMLIQCGNSKLNGRVTGLFKPFDLSLKVDSNKSSILFISSNESLESCINLKFDNSNKALNGFVDISPNNISLSFLKNEKRFEILSGDSLRFKFSQNLAPTDLNYKTSFSVRAKNFSALEVPKGNYDFIGEIKNDLSIEIRNAYGVMGRSEVEGSYSQSWNPNAFEFRLFGHCFPPDINNWLGQWWGEIWKNFTFPDEIPYGNFRIYGIWGGEIGNSKTYGSVEAGKIYYKEFKVNNSNIAVLVDENETKVISNNINHDKGNLSGSLAFPRKHLNTPTFLTFNLDGQYPLNEARTIFGEAFEKAVQDINATNLLCSASGEIFNINNENSTDSNFKVNIQSISPLTVKGFEIKELHGSVEKKYSLINGNFPKFQIADGQGQLNFKMESNGSEDKVALNFSLKDASKSLLIQDIIRAKKSGFIDKFSTNDNELDNVDNVPSTKGSLSLSIQAEGPLNNPLQFEGTGIIHLKEPKIGQINLFGKISEGLSNLKIPLPSDAFSFNELIIPFVLNNETMIFDNLNLTGPLSKVQAEGSFNLSSGTIDLIAKLSLIGNIPLPIIRNLIQLADPLSKIAEIKMTGDYQNPKWELLISNN